MMNGNIPNKKTCVKNSKNIWKTNLISWSVTKNLIQNSWFCKKMISWIFNLISLNSFDTCSFSPVKKHLLIPRAWKISMTWNMWHFFTLFGSFWYLSFKVTNNKKIVKIEVCGKNVGFWNTSENTKENLINFPDWFYFCSHF